MAAMGSVQNYSFFKAGVIIGGVTGLLSGMADANTFTRDLLTLIVFSLVGAVIGSAVLGLLGFVVDRIRGGTPMAG